MTTLRDFLLAARPNAEGVELEFAVVVGPYPTRPFLELLIGDLRPRQLTVVVDDGWPVQHLESLAQAAEDTDLRVIRVRANAPEGLVHAKLYFFQWRRPGTDKVWRRVAWGSANASLQALDGHAEVLSVGTLKDMSEPARTEIKSYFGGLRAGKAVAVAQLDLGSGIKLHLPAIRPARDRDETFDDWLRAGRLCQKYEHDNNFGKLTVKLIRSLPKTLHERVFQAGQFMRATNTSELHRDYLNLPRPDKGANPQWRAAFFTWTNYGFWTSGDCFRMAEDGDLVSPTGASVQFRDAHPERRVEVVDCIRSATTSDRNQWADELVAELADRSAALKEQGKDPRKWLRHTTKGSLDSTYRKIALAKLNRDLVKANTESFRRRYLAGFDFPKVPLLGEEFDDFAASLCESILRVLPSGRVNNRFALAVRGALDARVLEGLETGERLRDHLQGHWPQLRSKIRDFHLRGSINGD